MVQVEAGDFLVQCWFIQHVVPSPAKDIEHYYNLFPPDLNFQGVGGVHKRYVIFILLEIRP